MHTGGPTYTQSRAVTPSSQSPLPKPIRKNWSTSKIHFKGKSKVHEHGQPLILVIMNVMPEMATEIGEGDIKEEGSWNSRLPDFTSSRQELRIHCLHRMCLKPLTLQKRNLWWGNRILVTSLIWPRIGYTITYMVCMVKACQRGIYRVEEGTPSFSS